MKLLVLTAIIAAVSTQHLRVDQQLTQNSPWQVGKLYRYEVHGHTLARLHEGASSGSAFRAVFIVRVKSPNHLLAKLDNPQHAHVHQHLVNRELPEDLTYEPVPNMDKPFEIVLDGGRVESLNLPSSLPLPYENILKGLVGALQVDLSTHRIIAGSPDNFDKESQQGLFRKMETDVTGDCETLYAVSPVAAEWRRELPKFAADEDPIEITKSKNYGHCHYRVDYNFGVPDVAEWKGTAKPEDEQFIRRATVSRILASKQGHIYKAETTSTVNVHPHMYGKQKAEVYSNVVLLLVDHREDNESEWQKPEGSRLVKSLLYSLTTKQVAYHDRSESSEKSSHSLEHEHRPQSEEQTSRKTRSVSPKLAAMNTYKVGRPVTRLSSTSDSRSDSSAAYVNDEIPSINEPAYAALYMSPESHAVKKQNTMNVQKLLQDIAQQLQNPNNMPKADFLSKFTILVRIITVMNAEQLTQTSRSIEAAKSSNNIVKADMWMIYRDAVVQAGTLPAFQQIKTWIQSKKIQGEEAAQVVATLATTLRYPTKEVMKQFFELALSPEVREQRFLNTSALIAATRFINIGHVDNSTAHSRYPTHMYGRLARKHDSFVLDDILPRLTEELKKAIERKDSTQAQVYIKAIGNLGHREILKVFAPYLEGKIETSTFLRVQMLRNLQIVAKSQDKQARAVFFSILRNTAEPYEVRVAAIHNIFMATPTHPMMLVMAQMTHEDPSVEVRAVLKYGIESAARLTIPRYIELARNAESARPMLTKENFSYLNSIKKLNDVYDNEYEVGIFSSFSQIGSDDSVIPKLFKYSLETKKSGWKSPNSIEGGWSSVQDFVDFWKATLLRNTHKHNSEHKFSAEKISEMLKIKRTKKQPLEASFSINLLNQERLFTFDESDLKQLPIDIQHYMSEVSNGVDKHYTKVLNQAYVSVMFPLASGLPFLFKYREPTVIHIHSKAKGDMVFSLKDRDFKSTMDKEIKFTFARNLDGSVGFMDTITNQYASVGVVNKLQLNIPIKMNIQLQKNQLKLRLEPIVPDQDITTFHYSVWPYSASQKKDTLVTVAQDPSTKVIERPRKTITYDTKVGQKLGLLFHFQGYSYSDDYRNSEKMFMSRDLLTNIVELWEQRDIALTHMNTRFLVKQSQTKVVTLNAVFDSLHNQKQGGEIGEPTEMQDVTPNSEPRRQEIMKRVASGINGARVQVLDLSAVFEGQQKVEYVLTTALADSPVDTLIQYVIFAGKNAQQGKFQVNAVGALKKPEVSLMNFQEALKKEIKVLFKNYVKYGKDSVIEIEAQAQRNQRYTEELEKMPLGKVCEQQIYGGNLYQDACHKMIIRANAPNVLQATVSYKNIDSQVMNMTYHLYGMVKHFGFWNAEVNPMKRTAEGKIEIDADVDFTQNILQWSMVSKYGRLQMENVPIPRWSADALAVYTPFSAYERVQNHNSRHQFQPYCSVDGSKIRTFSNRSYDYTLSRSWHVVLQDEAREQGNWHDLVILARRPQPKQQEIYISYQSENGKVLEIEIQPSTPQKYNVHVTTNGNKVSEGDLTMYWNELTDRPLLTYFTQQDGVLVLFIEDMRLRLMLDGERLVVLSNDHRGTARGICGHMSGDPRDDYETPVGLVDKPVLYGASFALNVDNSDPLTQELQMKAKEEAYQPKHKFTSILRSDDEWKSIMHAHSPQYSNGETVYRSIPWKPFPSCTIQQQTQFYETSDETCVSIDPLPVCPSNCRGVNYVIIPYAVSCSSKRDQHFRQYVDEIREGHNPHIAVPPHYQSELRQFRVPIECSE